MPEIISSHIYISGRVQGVGYRDFAQRRAAGLQLNGYARNLADGRVEIEVEGERAKIEELIRMLWQGPPRAKVASVDVSWGPSSTRFQEFSIRF